jgi:two-component sensor histidine kinase/DNA-binding NarL/FixJ family response regulator
MKNIKISIALISMHKGDLENLEMVLKDTRISITSIVTENLIHRCADYSGFDCIIFDFKVWSDCNFKLDYQDGSKINKAIPVIFTGDQNNPDLIIESFKKGADDFISFPFRQEEVSARIANQIFSGRSKISLISEMEKKTSDLINTNSLLSDSVAEYRQILKDLQENETLLLTIALNIPNSYLAIVEKNFTIGFAAGQEFKKGDLDPWRLIGLSLEKVFKNQTGFVQNNLQKTFNGEEISFEIEINNQHLLFKSVPLFNSAGAVLRILVVAENITEQKISEVRLLESLKEKETLLKEIHHRVKNNMQLVCSMINLQAESIVNQDVRNTFRILHSRIYSMSLVHEKLYQHKQFSKINFKDYVNELVSGIRNEFSGDNIKDNVTIDLTLYDKNFTIDKAMPCGLILNELILNALKHASLQSGEGVIKVIFEKREDGLYSLTVKDNGRGLPEGFDINRTDSMGMMLVRELVAQLKGEISVKSDVETVFTIVFGDNSYGVESEIFFTPTNGSKNILLVEDERIISRMLIKIIEGQGYNIVDAVSSGRSAIDSAGKHNPDLVIMDIMLEGDIDGVQAASEIIKNSSCPIIFLTGNSDPATLKSAQEINPHRMMTKPVDKNQLITAIESALKNRLS